MDCTANNASEQEAHSTEQMEDGNLLPGGATAFLGIELSLGMDLDFGMDGGSPLLDLGATNALEELVDFLETGEVPAGAVDAMMEDCTFGIEDRWPI